MRNKAATGVQHFAEERGPVCVEATKVLDLTFSKSGLNSRGMHFRSKAVTGDGRFRKWNVSLRLMLVAACACALAGCHPGTLLEIFNNTGRDITVVPSYTEKDHPPYRVPNGQSIEIGIPSALEIGRPQGAWRYERLLPDAGRYLKKLRSNVYTVKLQVEANGDIYIILPDATAVATALPKQPSGFPLKPNGH